MKKGKIYKPKPKCIDCGKDISKRAKRCMVCANKLSAQKRDYTKNNNPFYGKKHKDKSKKQISLSKTGIKGRKHSKETIEKIRKWNIGKSVSSKTKLKISENHADVSGNKNPRWNGGSSLEVYPSIFNKILKALIRERDNHICQECGKTEQENGRKLAVHHIDYKKKNCNEDNLISLCHSCHNKTNTDRPYWQKRLTKPVSFEDVITDVQRWRKNEVR